MQIYADIRKRFSSHPLITLNQSLTQTREQARSGFSQIRYGQQHFQETNGNACSISAYPTFSEIINRYTNPAIIFIMNKADSVKAGSLSTFGHDHDDLGYHDHLNIKLATLQSSISYNDASRILQESGGLTFSTQDGTSGSVFSGLRRLFMTELGETSIQNARAISINRYPRRLMNISKFSFNTLTRSFTNLHKVQISHEDIPMTPHPFLSSKDEVQLIEEIPLAGKLYTQESFYVEGQPFEVAGRINFPEDRPESNSSLNSIIQDVLLLLNQVGTCIPKASAENQEKLVSNVPGGNLPRYMEQLWLHSERCG